MASLLKRVVVLATGGTIAGASSEPSDNVRYRAGQVAVESLLKAVPALRSVPLEARQLAQIDSKDMSHSLWWMLSQQIAELLARDEVSGVVITHGTDTLEETAYWLWRTVVATKPVVLTAAMRPASSVQADGPQNLLDAVRLAQYTGARGVLAVVGGQVLAGHELRKVHNYRLDALSPGDSGPVAWLEEGVLRQVRPWPAVPSLRWAMTSNEPAWPWVDIVTSHAGANGRLVDLLAEQGVQGLVVAATGNGTIHTALNGALQRAAARGVRVLRSTRCVLGYLVDDGGEFEGAAGLTPAQARVELMLRLLSAPAV